MTERARRPEVSVQQLESYLLAKQWINDAELRKVATVWHRADSTDSEVVLPMSPSVKDFRQRIQDALAAIGSHEARPVAAVIGDVLRASANVITVRVTGADTTDGTIPINDGVLLIAKAKEMLYAAAMSMYAKRKQFAGTPPKDAKVYVDSLLLGQTEFGSYVVNVIAPIQPQPFGVAQTPVAEAVTLSLVHGLEALSVASDLYEEAKDLTVFDASVSAGASANLCDALLGFSGHERKREFEIRISGVSGPMFEGETKVFSFDAAQVKALADASGYFKDDYVLLDRRIWGFIKRLHRPNGEEVGTITIEAVVGGAERSIQISLAPEDYHKAVLAHDQKAIVQCRGDIQVRSRSAVLLNPTGFEVKQLGDLF